MYRFTRHVAIAAVLSGTLSGCGDFLQGPSVDEDPNNPATFNASAEAIFAGLQSQQFAAYTNPLTVTICGWVQQCSATNGRFVQDQLMEYNINTFTFDGTFQQIYAQGGLGDIRVIQQKLAARTPPDLLFTGILEVWEALMMSSAADKWGAIPYSEAAGTVATPKLDPQPTVYAATLTLLDKAISDLGAGQGVGPGTTDFVYGGDPTLWIPMAHTLKARILQHQVRTQCVFSTAAGSCAGPYTAVRDEAVQGIQIAGVDFTTKTSGGSALESNGWFQFYNLSGFGFPDLRMGSFFFNLLSPPSATNPNGRNDPRQSTLIEPSGDTEGPYIKRSIDPSGAAFPQPWITGRENALILAEALFYMGDVAGALTQVNAVRASVPGTPPLAPLVGPITIDKIIEEKYVELFQNPEAWNDYKRLCLPALTPTETAGSGPIPTEIPRRIYYGQTEADINPNIPDATTQVTTGGPNLPNFRNPNDPPPPQGCTPIQH
jgi:hypothetical protein